VHRSRCLRPPLPGSTWCRSAAPGDIDLPSAQRAPIDAVRSGPFARAHALLLRRPQDRAASRSSSIFRLTNNRNLLVAIQPDPSLPRNHPAVADGSPITLASRGSAAWAKAEQLRRAFVFGAGLAEVAELTGRWPAAGAREHRVEAYSGL
jgi:hypothetical protein